MSPGLTMAMSARPVFASPACVNVALIPPDRMKLPSATARIRSTAGLYVTVTATLEICDAPEIEIGTLYGPPPTRKSPDGGDTMIWPDTGSGGAAPVVAAAGAWAPGCITPTPGAGATTGPGCNPAGSGATTG